MLKRSSTPVIVGHLLFCAFSPTRGLYSVLEARIGYTAAQNCGELFSLSLQRQKRRARCQNKEPVALLLLLCCWHTPALSSNPTTRCNVSPFNSLFTSHFPSRNHIWSCLGKITVLILSRFWAAVGTPSSLGGRAATARCGRWVGAAELDLGEGKAHPLYNPPNLLRLCLTVTPKRLERGTPNNSQPAGDCSGHCD